jgi:hypothetical protein
MNTKKKTKEAGAAAKPGESKAEKPKAAKKTAKYVGKTLKIELPGGAKFEGLCIGERKIPGGEQVFLKLNGLVSRYFNVQDIVE